MNNFLDEDENNAEADMQRNFLENSEVLITFGKFIIFKIRNFVSCNSYTNSIKTVPITKY